MLFTDVIATLFTQVLQVSSTRPELGASALSGRAASGAFEAFSPYLNHLRNFNYLLMLLQPYYI